MPPIHIIGLCGFASAGKDTVADMLCASAGFARMAFADRLRADFRPIAGTRLVRDYRGVEQVVTVLVDGFEWQGRPYQSLSAIARAITGTRWRVNHSGW